MRAALKILLLAFTLIVVAEASADARGRRPKHRPKRAPEIDPTTLVAGLGAVAGAFAMVADRRRKRK